MILDLFGLGRELKHLFLTDDIVKLLSILATLCLHETWTWPMTDSYIMILISYPDASENKPQIYKYQDILEFQRKLHGFSGRE